jgi:hypothetical protein
LRLRMLELDANFVQSASDEQEQLWDLWR